MECKYNCDEFCINDQCPMHGDYCPVPNYEGVCKYEEREDERYVLTPRGCLFVALTDNNIKISADDLDAVWSSFEELMRQHGYVEEPDNTR